MEMNLICTTIVRKALKHVEGMDHRKTTPTVVVVVVVKVHSCVMFCLR
jgi:hypothetical protein